MSHDEHHQLELERYRETCDAIDRCAKAGADIHDLRTIARECGVDIRHTLLGDIIKEKA